MRGFFGIGVYRPKTEINIGTLWRHAYIYNAAFIFTIEKRYHRQRSDTLAVPNHVPLYHYETIEDFNTHLPYDTHLIAIELTKNAVALSTYKHPKRAVYLLGAEDDGLPDAVLDLAQEVIYIESFKAISLNVATAGTLVMYDRYAK